MKDIAVKVRCALCGTVIREQVITGEAASLILAAGPVIRFKDICQKCAEKPRDAAK